MKWYKRDAQRAREGMRFLTLEERGAYNTLLDLATQMDNNLRDDRYLICGYLRCDPRVWKRLRARLIALRKITVEEGYLRPDFGAIAPERGHKHG